MTRSGYDEPDIEPDWSQRDEMFAKMDRRDFKRATFKPIPALVSRGNRGSWTRYYGQAFDDTEWELVPDMWDHEHCELCFAHIEPGMTYWNSRNDTFLCDRCYDHYLACASPGR
jgi:hypothetical protein